MLQTRDVYLQLARLPANLTIDFDFYDNRQTPEGYLKTEQQQQRFVPKPVSLTRIFEVAEHANIVLEAARETMLQPNPQKRPPEFTTLQVAQLCGLEKARVNYLLSRPNNTLPVGRLEGKNRIFTLVEARAWVREVGVDYVARPDHAKGFIIACSNLKGGSTKSTTALHLAQGQTLRGRTVCLVDLDPQCSLTVMMDKMPGKDVNDENTIVPYFNGQEDDLAYAVQATYWDGIDIIPAGFGVFGIEVVLPIAANNDPEFDFWEMLADGLAPLREKYDVIILDTPPSLSYLTFNAIYAADGVVIPLPPESLDFASSVSFWRLFADLFKIANSRRERRNLPPIDKAFDFINVLLSKVNTSPHYPATPVVRGWIGSAYEDMVLPVEIPMSGITSGKASQFGSIYDISQYSGDKRTYQRIREACDRFVELIDQQIMATWTRNEK